MQGDPRIIDLLNQVLRKEEHAALAVLRPGIALCLEIGDHGTRDLLERIVVVDEEHHIDWIEAQRHKIAEVGYQQFLAQQIYA